MIAIVLGLVLGSLALSTSTNPACEDKSTTACQRLAALKPDICQDNCTATLCPKTCGKCPLTCYSCSSVPDPSKCHTTKTCGDISMLCITSQTLDENLQRTYRQGCVDPQICSSLYGTFPNRTTPNIRRDVNFVGGCCGSDLCNKYAEPEKAPIPTMHTDPAVSSIHKFSPICNQIDEVVCTHLVTSTGCSDPCVSKICPQKCGHCNLKCFECNKTDHPGNCNTRITCNGAKEVCSVASKSGSYELTCLDSKICRDTITNVGRGGTCCATDFCNGYFNPINRLETTHTPITTGHPVLVAHTTNHHSNNTTRHHLGLPTDCVPKLDGNGECPVGFSKMGTSCYYAGTKYEVQTDAVVECHSMCTRLAIISSERENLKLTNFLGSLRTRYHEANFYWIDGFLSNSHWRWNSTSTAFGSHTYANWKPNTPDNLGKNGEHCLEFGKGEDVHHSHPHGYYWNDRSCSHRYPALCEYPLSHVA